MLNKHHRGLHSRLIIEQPLSQLRLALDFVVNDILDTPPRQSTPRARRERTPTLRQRQGHLLASKTRGRLSPADLESPSLQLLLGTVSGSWDGTGLSNWVWPPGTLLPRTLVKPNGNYCKACEEHTQNTDGGGLYENLKRTGQDTMGFQGSRNSSVQFKNSPRSLS